MSGKTKLIFGIVIATTLVFAVAEFLVLYNIVRVRHIVGSAASIESVPGLFQPLVVQLHPQAMEWNHIWDPWAPEDRICMSGLCSSSDVAIHDLQFAGKGTEHDPPDSREAGTNQRISFPSGPSITRSGLTG